MKLKHVVKKKCALGLAVVLLVLNAAPLFADAEVPLIVMSFIYAGKTWVQLLLAMLVLVGLEAFIATTLLKISYRTSLGAVFQANVMSTGAGIPIALLVTHWELVRHSDSGYASSPNFVFHQNTFLITCFCFFLSVFVERSVMASLIKTATSASLWAWSWLANAASYGMILIPMLSTLSPIAHLPYSFPFDTFQVTVQAFKFVPRPACLSTREINQPGPIWLAVQASGRRIKGGGGNWNSRGSILRIQEPSGTIRNALCWDPDEDNFQIYFEKPQSAKIKALFADGRHADIVLPQ